MKINISRDARPQVATLLIASVISLALWFIPYADVLTYPFRIFVTFIHEGGHAIAALLTGNSVQSLNVNLNASGETYTTGGGLISRFFISSAGYLGAITYGGLLLFLIRRAVASRLVLMGSAALILGLTILYGLGSPFTLVSGILLPAGLFAVARFATPRVATFFVSFLAVQSVLNALFDLKTVLFLSSPFGSGAATDAANMANATGIPAMFWALLWIGISISILCMAMRFYAVSREKGFQKDLPFEESFEV